MDMTKIPKIPTEDLVAAKNDMKDYILVSNIEENAKEFVCTKCKSRYLISFPARMYTQDERDLFRAKHRQTAKCARCGHETEVINTGRLKRLSTLNIEQPSAFFMPASADEAYLRCVLLHKCFTTKIPVYSYSTYEVYHFVKGQKTEYIRYRYNYGDFIEPKKIREPFGFKSSAYGFEYKPYRIYGKDKMQQTFFRYSLFDMPGYANVNNGILYLALYAEYPQITEMLLKAGYTDLVDRKIKGEKTNHVIKWNAKNLKSLFKLSIQERAEWKKCKNDMKTMDVYKRLFRGKKNGMEHAKDWVCQIGLWTNETSETIKRIGTTPEELLKYVKSEVRPSVRLWLDYIDAAIDIGYDMTVHNVAYPKNLVKAHDEAVKIRKIKIEEIEKEKAKKRFDALMQQYGYEADGYLIRAPYDTDEIIAEGKALKHCVGGYAARHARAETTILFMRRADKPDKPLYTIEMRGTALMQVHGLQNKTAPSDNPDTRDFFDGWLEWVKDGSKRKGKQSKTKAHTPKKERK